MDKLNPFEQSLFLYSKGRYAYEGNRVEGARAVVAHIAGIPICRTADRQVALWLVNVLVCIDRTSPTSIPGGLAFAIGEMLEYMNPVRMLQQRPTSAGYWGPVIEALMGQIAITQVAENGKTLLEMPSKSDEIQQALDREWLAHLSAPAVLMEPRFTGLSPTH